MCLTLSSDDRLGPCRLSRVHGGSRVQRAYRPGPGAPAEAGHCELCAGRRVRACCSDVCGSITCRQDEGLVAPVATTRESSTATKESTIHSSKAAVSSVPVDRIRPEEGLSRKRDQGGHRELQQSIQQFGVLTPITVRPAPDGSGDYLLVKGQGRTLACRILGMSEIPAIIVDAAYAESEKVQQFLVENVARLKMRPVDRALLIQKARQDGEETTEIAKRFGLSATTVRRLLAQLDGASKPEVKALESGEMSLAMHAVIARHVEPSDRSAVLDIVRDLNLKPKELESLFSALGWQKLTALGSTQFGHRITLLDWACREFVRLPAGAIRDRLQALAINFPTNLTQEGNAYGVVWK